MADQLSWLERVPYKHEVAGSIPAFVTSANLHGHPFSERAQKGEALAQRRKQTKPFIMYWWKRQPGQRTSRYLPPLSGQEIGRFTKESCFEGLVCRCAFSLGKASSEEHHKSAPRQTRVVRMECPYDCRRPQHMGVRNLTYSAYSYRG